MSVLTLPVPKSPFRSQRTKLDGTDYLLSFAYNQREDRWYLSIADDEENPIVSGIKILANWPLLFRYRTDTRIPPGELIAVDLTSDGTPPGLNELGQGLRCQLIYYDAAEIAAMFTPVFLAFSVTAGGGYIGDAAFTEAIVKAFTGSPVSLAGLLRPGISAQVTGFDLGFSAPAPGPTTLSSKVLVAGANQIFTLSAANISVVST